MELRSPLPVEFPYICEVSQVGGMEVAAHPPERRHMPPPLDLETHVGVDLHLTDRLTLFTAQHTYWRQNTNDGLYNLNGVPVRGDNGSDASYVGNEFDIVLNWQIGRHTSAYIGWAHFFAGDFIAESGASKDVDFLYTSITFTF